MRTTGIKREKMCRKFGQKMLLRPERCASPKCAFTRRQTIPGTQGAKRRRRRAPTPYGMQLLEKQKLRLLYGFSERALKRFVREALERTTMSPTVRNALDIIAEGLELRLDSVVYRLGIAPSRAVARQYVSHGHVCVNGVKTRVPSAHLRVGDVVSIRNESAERIPFRDLSEQLRKHRIPSWLEFDTADLRGKVIAPPKREEALVGVDLAKILEYYAR